MRHASYYTVTTYSGPNPQFCSNNATLVPTSLCTSMSIGSFSVDCMGINGTQEDVYTTLRAAGTSSSTEAPLVKSSTSTSTTELSTEPVATKSSSQQSIATLIPLPETHLTASSSLPATPTSTTLSLSEDLHSSPSSSNTPPPSSSSPSSSASSSSSPSSESTPSATPSTKPPTNYGNDGGLSGPSTIAIDVVLPGVAIVVTVVFGVLGLKWRKEKRRLRREEEERRLGVESEGRGSEEE